MLAALNSKLYARFISMVFCLITAPVFHQVQAQSPRPLPTLERNNDATPEARALAKAKDVERVARLLDQRLKETEKELADLRNEHAQSLKEVASLKTKVASLERNQTRYSRPTSLSSSDRFAPSSKVGDTSDTGNFRSSEVFSRGSGGRPALPAGAPQTTLGSAPAHASSDEPRALFNAAKRNIAISRFDEAERGFSEYLAKYGDTSLAPEAQYWLGHSLFVQEAYEEASAAYAKLVQDHRTSQFAPRAMVKLAESLRMRKDKTRACALLNSFESTFPDAPITVKTEAAEEMAASDC